MMKMQICTFFNPLLMWREQLTPLMGQEEVDRLDGRLKELNITGLNYLRVEYTDMFPLPDRMEDQQFWRMLTSIGSWPLVSSQHAILYIVEYSIDHPLILRMLVSIFWYHCCCSSVLTCWT